VPYFEAKRWPRDDLNGNHHAPSASFYLGDLPKRSLMMPMRDDDSALTLNLSRMERSVAGGRLKVFAKMLQKHI
jgi:hypothetical protein